MDHLRHWQAQVERWRDTHPWRYATFIAVAVALLGGFLYTPLGLVPFSSTLRHAVVGFLVWGVLGSLQQWWRGRPRRTSANSTGRRSS